MYKHQNMKKGSYAACNLQNSDWCNQIPVHYNIFQNVEQWKWKVVENENTHSTQVNILSYIPSLYFYTVVLQLLPQQDLKTSTTTL